MISSHYLLMSLGILKNYNFKIKNLKILTSIYLENKYLRLIYDNNIIPNKRIIQQTKIIFNT